MPTGRANAITTSTILAATLLAGLTGCTFGSSGDGRPGVQIVPVGLLSGEVDEGPGADARRGAELAVAVVNEAHPDLALPLAPDTGLPGLGGAPLALAVEDTAATAGTDADATGLADAAESAMDSLVVQRGVTGVVAADRAATVETAGAYADRQEVPLVDGGTTPGFLLDVGLEWYFRTGPSDRAITDAVFALLPASAGAGQAHRLTVLTPADGRGADLAALVNDRAEAAGFEVTPQVAAGEGVAGRLAAVAPDIVVALAPAPADGPELHRAVDAWNPPEPGPGTVPEEAAQLPPGLVVGLGQGYDTRDPGQMRDGMLHAAAWSQGLAEPGPLARAVAAEHEDMFGTPLTEAGARAFTAILTLALAVDAAASADRVAVRAALRQLSVPATQTIMPWNGIRFGTDGQNELAVAVVEQDQPDGVRLVHPPELAVAELAWQPPARGI